MNGYVNEATQDVVLNVADITTRAAADSGKTRITVTVPIELPAQSLTWYIVCFTVTMQTTEDYMPVTVSTYYGLRT